MRLPCAEEGGLCYSVSRLTLIDTISMMGVFSEFERAMIRERVNAGLARAKANGKTLGRPKTEANQEAAILATLMALGDFWPSSSALI